MSKIKNYKFKRKKHHKFKKNSVAKNCGKKSLTSERKIKLFSKIRVMNLKKKLKYFLKL